MPIKSPKDKGNIYHNGEDGLMNRKPIVAGLLTAAAFGAGLVLSDVFIDQYVVPAATTKTGVDPAMEYRLSRFEKMTGRLAHFPTGVSSWLVRRQPGIPEQIMTDLQDPLEDGKLTVDEMIGHLAALGASFPERANSEELARAADILKKYDIEDIDGTLARGIIQYFLHHQDAMPVPASALEAEKETEPEPAAQSAPITAPALPAPGPV